VTYSQSQSFQIDIFVKILKNFHRVEKNMLIPKNWVSDLKLKILSGKFAFKVFKN
jgi:hypothetical protein